MKEERTAASLSDIERRTLKALASGSEFGMEKLSMEARLHIDSVRRAVQWLSEKGLAEVREKKTAAITFTAMGAKAAELGLAEERAVRALKELGGRAAMGDVAKKAMLDAQETGVALGIMKFNAWVSLHKGKEIELELTGLEESALKDYAPAALLKKIAAAGEKGTAEEILSGAEKKAADELAKRGLVQREESVERSAVIKANGREVLAALERIGKRRVYDVAAEVPGVFVAKKQPYVQFLSQIRRKLVELGFKEMETKLVELEFYNFDVLFQPQNHPARSWSDTYILKNPSHGVLENRKAVGLVKAAHETGGKTKSKGWGYKWSEEIAAKLMPCAHGTAASARQLVKGVEVPGKYFAVARCYRPDVADATHLNEFNQMEGFIVDKGFSFRHLLGMLKQFAVEIAGAEEVKFYPDYYPFTEPSVQLSAKHPQMGWIEFGGAGIFRPEITQQLGIRERVLAWGLGIDRLAMFKLGIADIRWLFSHDLNWLRNERVVL